MADSGRVTRLAALFGDHCVLQAERPCPVWGWDAPEQDVTLTLCTSGAERRTLQTHSTRADANGRFSFELTKSDAGGPYELSVEGSTRSVAKDVWFGEVWLASGQSNMEWKVASSNDAEREIQSARFPLIRSFKVPARTSQEPLADVDAGWAVCSPDTVLDFSAVAYFFAREVHERKQVAVGFIDASWGGTCIEAWTSLEALAPVLPDLAEQRGRLARELADLPRITQEYERKLGAWQRQSLPQDEHNLGEARGWARPEFDDASWKTLPLPCFWQPHGLDFNGVVWFRRAFEVPARWAGRELTLSLGAIDDFDDTYFDGERVGKTPPGTAEAHRLRRRYTVPAARVKAGRSVVAVRVFDHVGGGGFAGPAPEMYVESAAELGRRVPLDGPWRYGVEREIPLVSMSVFASMPQPPLALAQQNTPAALFHGMLAALVPYALRGALWYQGESNVARHANYRALQVALVRDLRTRFGQGQFPFFWVQLANFTASADWPRLREAQAQALAEPETGMVVTLDIGDPRDIHPTNKQEVGRRLALLARARVYGERELVCEGPRLRAVHIEGARVRVELEHARGLRTSDGQAPRAFELAGADGRFVPAAASIEGERVWLSAAPVTRPCAVRYAWADAPDVNLQNAAGLPAAPFRTDIFG